MVIFIVVNLIMVKDKFRPLWKSSLSFVTNRTSFKSKCKFAIALGCTLSTNFVQ